MRASGNGECMANTCPLPLGGPLVPNALGAVKLEQNLLVKRFECIPYLYIHDIA